MTTPSGGSPSTEFERLTQDLDEARAQLIATDQVLTALGRAAADLDSVLGTVVESARRLSHADVAQIHLLEGDNFRLAAAVGHSDEYWDFLLRKQIALDRRSLVGRVGLDPMTALFMTPLGKEKHLVATDHLESASLQALSLDDLFDVVARHGLHFDQARQTGVVFHMISCLTEHGRVGLTAVGDTPAEAEALYQRAERILLDEAAVALAELELPPDWPLGPAAGDGSGGRNEGRDGDRGDARSGPLPWSSTTVGGSGRHRPRASCSASPLLDSGADPL